MKTKTAARLPLSVYIILCSVLVSNIIVTFFILKYFLL